MPDFDFRPDDEAAWNALLRQLRPEAARPQPFFYARVRGRLLRGPKPGLPAWLWRPAYAALLAALVLVVSGDGAAAPASPLAATRPTPQGR